MQPDEDVESRLEALPPELKAHLARYLDLDAVIQLSQTNKTLQLWVVEYRKWISERIKPIEEKIEKLNQYINGADRTLTYAREFADSARVAPEIDKMVNELEADIKEATKVVADLRRKFDDLNGHLRN